MNIKIGNTNISFPLNISTILKIPKFIALVFDITLKAPPTINKNAIISAPSTIPCIGACNTLNIFCGWLCIYLKVPFTTTVFPDSLTVVSYAPPGIIYVATATMAIITAIITKV